MAKTPVANQALLNILFDNSHTPIAYLDNNFNFIRVNQAYADADHREVDEFVGKNHFHLYPNRENETIFSNVRDSGIAYSTRARAFEYEYAPERGETYWDWSLTPVKEGELTTGILLQLVDVTERVRAEQMLYQKIKQELSAYDEELESIIEKRTKELQEVVEELQQKEKASRKTELLLKKARDEAEKSSLAKSQFLSRISHELRTPLNAIIGFAQLLKYDVSEQPQLESVSEIMHAGEHLLSMITDILDLSRIETGNVSVSIKNVDLHETVYEALALVKHKLGFRNIDVINNITTDSNITLIADETRIKEVLVNLLSNAIKYNKENGIVEITAEFVNDENVRISVSDTGKGLNNKEIEKIFEPFNRLGAEYTDIEGVGIGLSIAQKLMSMMKGVLGVQSEPGKGSVFFIECPCLPQEKATSSIAKSGQDIIELEVSGVEILYVEDITSNRSVMKKFCEQYDCLGLNVVGTAEEALELVKQKNFDLIILDLNLPGMSGFEALRELQNNSKTKNIPVIALTASAGQHDIRKGLDAGFKQYLTKPVIFDDLVTAINSNCSGQTQH